MRRLLTVLVFFAAIGSSQAGADTTVGGYIACVSKQSYDELMNAMAQKDEAALNYLEKQRLCFVLKAGIRASILDRGWTGWVKARLYVGDSAAVVWAPMEAFKS